MSKTGWDAAFFAFIALAIWGIGYLIYDIASFIGRRRQEKRKQKK